MNTPSLDQAIQMLVSHHKILVDVSQNVLRQKAEILALQDILTNLLETTSGLSSEKINQLVQEATEEHYQALMEAKEDQNPEIAALLDDRELPESLQ